MKFYVTYPIASERRRNYSVIEHVDELHAREQLNATIGQDGWASVYDEETWQRRMTKFNLTEVPIGPGQPNLIEALELEVAHLETLLLRLSEYANDRGTKFAFQAHSNLVTAADLVWNTSRALMRDDPDGKYLDPDGSGLLADTAGLVKQMTQQTDQGAADAAGERRDEVAP